LKENYTYLKKVMMRLKILEEGDLNDLKDKRRRKKQQI
jgi:hypothetical protein